MVHRAVSYININIGIVNSSGDKIPSVDRPSEERTVADEVGGDVRERKGEEPKSRRFAKGWFLTYPHCPLTSEQLLKKIEKNAINRGTSIREYVVCEETHKGGEPHLHAFVKYDRRLNFNNNLFDVACDGKFYHGHYEIAKSWRKVEDYVKKGGKFISNINISSALQKKSKSISLEDFKRDPLELLEEGVIKPMQLFSFVKNQNIYRMLQQKRERPPEDWFNLEKKRHFWVAGATNAGKTYWLRKQISQNPDDWFQIPKNNDWVGYMGQKYLYIDEYRGDLSVQQLNSICDGGSKVNTKGGSTLLNWCCVVYVLSNYYPREVYRRVSKETVKTLFSRFNIYAMQEHQLGEPIASDIWIKQIDDEPEPEEKK